MPVRPRRFWLRTRPEFIRVYGRLELTLQEEVRERVFEFRERVNHGRLKVHKLHGRMEGRLSFSVNYKYRIVFKYIDKNTAEFLTIGDHDIYK